MERRTSSERVELPYPSIRTHAVLSGLREDLEEECNILVSLEPVIGKRCILRFSTKQRRRRVNCGGVVGQVEVGSLRVSSVPGMRRWFDSTLDVIDQKRTSTLE
jgi:hypothetical protein